MKHIYDLDDYERDLIVQALACLAVDRVTWTYGLKEIAIKLGAKKDFEHHQEMRRHEVGLPGTRFRK